MEKNNSCQHISKPIDNIFRKYINKSSDEVLKILKLDPKSKAEQALRDHVSMCDYRYWVPEEGDEYFFINLNMDYSIPAHLIPKDKGYKKNMYLQDWIMHKDSQGVDLRERRMLIYQLSIL